MARFLSPEWVAELDAVARRDASLHALAASGRLVVEQRVTDTPDGEIAYHVTISGEGARVTPGRATAPDLVIVTTYPAAAALHEGRLNAQRALAQGSLRLQGNPEVVLRASDQIAALADVFAGVRHETTLGDASSRHP